jgi:prepilin-type N-terminal cleavage/methylation domain-containing protein
MMARARSRRNLGDDGGFTLTEVLIALIIGSIIVTASFTLLDVVMRRAGEVDQRVDTAQRGRMLMDVMTRELRSQICQTTDVPPIKATTSATAANGSYQQTVTFYTDLTDGRANTPPQMRTLRYDEATRTIIEYTYVATGNAPILYKVNPDRTRVLATNVVREVRGGVPVPIWSFYGFTTSVDPAIPATPTKALPLAMAEGSADVKMVARVGLNFEVWAHTRSTAGRTSTVYTDDVFVRAANPNDPAPIPTCV